MTRSEGLRIQEAEAKSLTSTQAKFCVAIPLAKFQMPKSKLQTNPNIEIQSSKLFWSLVFCALILFGIWCLGFRISYSRREGIFSFTILKW
jgi:hypothetical protein